MKEEIVKQIKIKLNEEIKVRLRNENFAKKAYKANIFTSHIEEERMNNNEYYFGNEIIVRWLNYEEIENRKIILRSIYWVTALNLRIGNNNIQNDPFNSIYGKIDDLIVSWEYDLDGVLKIKFEEINIQDFVEKRRD